MDVGLDGGERADGAGDVVAHGGAGGLGGGDLACAELLFDEGVVGGELRDLAGAEEVAAAVAYVGYPDVGGVWGWFSWGFSCGFCCRLGFWGLHVEDAYEGGAHAVEFGGGAGFLEDGLVGGADGGGESVLGAVGRVGRGQAFDEALGGEVAGDFSGGCSAHAVADDEGTGLEGGGRGILVIFADAAGVRERGVDENGC